MSSLMISFVSEAGESHKTIPAFERLFTCVCAHVHFKVSLLTKSFAAPARITHKLWLRLRTVLVGKMNAQSIFAGERFPAFFAPKSRVLLRENMRMGYGT